MTIATHPTRSELLDYTLGHLPTPQGDEIADHIDACSACGAELERLDGEADTVVSQLLNTRPDSQAADPALAAVMSFVKAVGRDVSHLPLPLGEGRGEGALGKLREYELLAKLGEGGMGTVYKARHTKLDRIVALKVLTPERMNSPEAVVRFEREMRAVGRLEHPNIVRAHDAGEFEGTHFLVMEYVAGLDLGQLVKSRGPLPVADACELIRQAALGLQYAHEHGLVHRDIKPSNLMLALQSRDQWSRSSPAPSPQSPAPVVKILDLGLALLQEPEQRAELTSSGQMMGTVDYMAPEQGQSSHTVDIRADIYSLGASLYKLLTGSTPFPAERYDTLMKKFVALATQPHAPAQSLRPDLPPGLCQLLDRLLAKAPQDRPQTPAAVAELLAPFAAGADLPALLSAPPLPLGEGRGEGDSATAPTIDRAASSDTASHLSSSLTGTTSDAIAPPPSPVENALRGVPALDEATAPASAPIVIQPHARPPRALPPFMRRLYWIVGASAAAILIAAIVVKIVTREGTLILSVEGTRSAEVLIDGEEAEVVFDEQGRYRVAVKPGTHTLVVTGPKGEQFETDRQFVMKPGGEATLTAQLIRKDPAVVPSAGDPTRRIAEMILRSGGRLTYNRDDKQFEVTRATELPAGPFTISDVVLSGRKELAASTLAQLAELPYVFHLNLGDSDISEEHINVLRRLKLGILTLDNTRMKSLKPLAEMDLHKLSLEGTQVTDADLQAVSGSPLIRTLEHIALDRTSVTDEGLKVLANDRLNALGLQETNITDAGLEHLKQLKFLQSLDVRKTKLTAPALQQLSRALPQCQIHWDGGVIEPTVVTDPDRRAAEWVLSVGGTVYTGGNWLQSVAELPAQPFQLQGFVIESKPNITDASLAVFKNCRNLGTIHLIGVSVTDNGLAHFKGCQNVESLVLSGLAMTDAGLENFSECNNLWQLHLGQCGKITDKGLALFANRRKLTSLQLYGTRVTDAGLAAFRDSANLKYLRLDDTTVTGTGFKNLIKCQKLASILLTGSTLNDDGLALLAECPDLRRLQVQRTKVTEVGVKRLAAALPQCKIEWDGGVIEPTVVADPERVVAEWVLSVGGAVSIIPDGSGQIGFEGKAARLPTAPFRIHVIGLNTGTFVPADLKRLRGLKPFYELALQARELRDEDVKQLEGIPVEKLVLFNNHLTTGALAPMAKVPGLKQLAITLESVKKEDWHRLKDIAQLQYLTVIGKNFGDGDVAALLEVATLQGAHLNGTALTDAGVEQLLEHPGLRAVALAQTEVTDKSLELLAKSSHQWEHINVSRTQVTEAGVKQLAAALPQCKIEWDGGVIEPTAPADSSRGASK